MQSAPEILTIVLTSHGHFSAITIMVHSLGSHLICVLHVCYSLMLKHVA